MADYTEFLKNSLQKEFSMPFEVSRRQKEGEDHYFFSPTSEGKELFDVDVHIANNIRIVLEITPQLHAASMLHDMETASVEKKELFSTYAAALERNGAKINCIINNIPTDIKAIDGRIINWRSFSIRITKAPVIEDDKNNASVIVQWSINATCMILSLLNVTDIIPEPDGYTEGNVFVVPVNKYERNPINRRLCLAIKGYKCQICGFDFEKTYGAIGKGFIHVHHLIPVSKMGPDYHVNPEKDLIPVCPNCHAMLHRNDPPYSPEELLDLMNKN